MSSKDVKEQIELTGSALLVYWYLLRRRQGCGVREIQRALGLSSSSTAHYHLEKMMDRNVLTIDRKLEHDPTYIAFLGIAIVPELGPPLTFVVVAALVSAVVLTMALVDLKKTRRMLRYSAEIPPTAIG